MQCYFDAVKLKHISPSTTHHGFRAAWIWSRCGAPRTRSAPRRAHSSPGAPSEARTPLEERKLVVSSTGRLWWFEFKSCTQSEPVLMLYWPWIERLLDHQCHYVSLALINEATLSGNIVYNTNLSKGGRPSSLVRLLVTIVLRHHWVHHGNLKRSEIAFLQCHIYARPAVPRPTCSPLSLTVCVYSLLTKRPFISEQTTVNCLLR